MHKLAIPVLMALYVFIPGNTMASELDQKSVLITFENEVDHEYLTNLKAKIITEFKYSPTVEVLLPHTTPSILSYENTIQTIQDNIETEITLSSETTDYGIEKVKAPLAWSTNFTGKNVKVAILDTGIDTAHNDLAVAGGASFVAEPNGVINYKDYHGHGTHVAGIIAAKHNGLGVKGVAPDANIYAVKVINSTGSGSVSTILQGIEWAIDNDMDIINMSLGFQEDVPVVNDTLKIAESLGIISVAAAGNDGTSNTSLDNVDYPARYPSVIAVGAVDAMDNRSSFSSTGPSVEIAAPGSYIYSTHLSSNYQYKSGTSMASPYAAGVLALLKEANPSLSNIELRKLMNTTAIDLGASGKDSVFGNGLIQYTSTLRFSDVYKDYWAYNPIIFVAEQNWMNGKNSVNTFYPKSSLTRAEAAVVFVRVLNLQALEPTTQSFHDVKTTHWAYSAIEISKQHKLFGGVEDGKFAPSEPLKRQEIAVVLSRIVISTNTQPTSTFKDVPTSHWAYSSIANMAANDIVGGYSDNTFRPNNSVTRAEMATLIQRSHTKFK